MAYRRRSRASPPMLFCYTSESWPLTEGGMCRPGTRLAKMARVRILIPIPFCPGWGRSRDSLWAADSSLSGSIRPVFHAVSPHSSNAHSLPHCDTDEHPPQPCGFAAQLPRSQHPKQKEDPAIVLFVLSFSPFVLLSGYSILLADEKPWSYLDSIACPDDQGQCAIALTLMPALRALNSLATVTNNSNELEALRVICSWPVSGQYGAGSRILYYVLVAACILARKTEWLRNACLAAALIFPAIAAVHGIVLAALHREDAVDLDIYGALQMCAIGILTAPACVRLSKTYFNTRGKSVLFLWFVLVLAGLLALAVEFFRTKSNPCMDNGSGQPLYRGSSFPYGETTCGLVCSVEDGPHSPMRGGSADNIYVVPTPNVLGFGAATLIAAACCIPGVLSMVSTWNKILRTNWAKQFGVPETDEVIEGTNGATVKGMKGVNDVIRRLLSVVEIPVFGGAVLALIVVGELNFWSGPLNFQTEEIANVGQWWSIGASVLAACGSLYLLTAEYLDTAEAGPTTAYPLESCDCTCHHHGISSRTISLSENTETAEIPRPPERSRTSDAEQRVGRRENSPSDSLTPVRTDTYPDTISSAHGLGIRTIDSGASSTGNGGGVKGAIVKLVTAFETASPDRFDDSAFRQGKATGFPEVPGEGNRNDRLNLIRQKWGGDLTPDDEDALTPRGRRSRTNSFNGGISRPTSIGPRTHSPQPPPTSVPSAPGPSLLGIPTSASPESTCESMFPTRPSAELETTRSQGTVVTLHQGLNSPDIVLSSEDEPSDTLASSPTNPPRPPLVKLPP